MHPLTEAQCPDLQVLSNAEKVFKDKQQWEDAADFLVYQSSFLNLLGACPRLDEILHFDGYPFAHEAAVYIPSSRSLFVTSNQYRPGSSGTSTSNKGNGAGSSSTPRSAKQITISRLRRCSHGQWLREELDADVPMANGGVNYRNGVLFCSQGSLSRTGGLIWMSADAPHRVWPLLDNYHGRLFNSLNDVVVHSDGSIWFTDPTYGFEQQIRPRPELPNQVYRYDPGSGDVRAIADSFGRPNGICFSPDERTVYISDTERLHGDLSTDDTRASTMWVPLHTLSVVAGIRG